MSNVPLDEIKLEPEFAINHQGNGKTMEQESEEYLHYNVSNFFIALLLFAFLCCNINLIFYVDIR